MIDEQDAKHATKNMAAGTFFYPSGFRVAMSVVNKDVFGL